MNLELNNRLNAADVLKFMGIIVMIIAHCFIFLYRIFPPPEGMYHPGLMQKLFYFNGFYSLILPAVAGVVFRDTVSPYWENGKICNLPLHRIIGFFLLLSFLESTKNALTFGLIYAFKWDVLHFIGLSFVFITIFLTYFSFRWLSLFAVFIWLLTYVYSTLSPNDVGPILMKYFYFTPVQSSDITELKVGICSLIFLSLCSLVGFFYLRDRNFSYKTISRKNIIRILFVFLSIIGTYLFYSEMKSNSVFFGIVWNLPLSIFVEIGQVGGHIWPMIPWLSLVILGFVAKDIQVLLFSKLWQRILVIVVLYTIFFRFFLYSIDSYQQLFSQGTFFGAKYFAPEPFILFQVYCFFLCVFYLFDLIFSRFQIHSSLIKQISQAILPVYLIHLFLAWKLLPGLSLLCPPQYIYWVYPALIVFLTYCFLSGFLLVSGKMIWFRLRKL